MTTESETPAVARWQHW